MRRSWLYSRLSRGRKKLRGHGNWSDAIIAEAYGEIAGAAIGHGLGEGYGISKRIARR